MRFAELFVFALVKLNKSYCGITRYNGFVYDINTLLCHLPAISRHPKCLVSMFSVVILNVIMI